MTLMILAGLGIGILSSFTGLGGGFLAVPILLYLGRTTQAAVGTSFVLVLIIALSSLAAHYRLGNVDIGPLILQQVSDQNFKRVFGCVMVGLGIWMVMGSRSPS